MTYTEWIAEHGDLIEALTMIQNHPAHDHHDILTTAACAPRMNRAELLRQIDHNMEIIARWTNERVTDRKPRRRAHKLAA